MSNKSTTSIINYFDDELDQVIEEAIEQFAQCNIRFRTPNRNNGPKHQQKYYKPERESWQTIRQNKSYSLWLKWIAFISIEKIQTPFVQNAFKSRKWCSRSMAASVTLTSEPLHLKTLHHWMALPGISAPPIPLSPIFYIGKNSNIDRSFFHRSLGRLRLSDNKFKGRNSS